MISIACMYIGSKIQEEPIRLRDLINLSYKYIYPSKDPPSIGNEYDKIKNSVIKCEFILSQTLGYRFNCEHPYKYLIHFLNIIYDWVEQKSFDSSKLSSIASHLLSDSEFTSLSVRYSAPAQASIVMYAALHVSGLKIPFIKDYFSLCSILCPGLKEEELISAGSEILKFYL
ncbi:hypothetical protein MXB_930 [Myxobolus squamalis]|nr:hypothetical protein MXB_930 [Myxobolus squamalis]